MDANDISLLSSNMDDVVAALRDYHFKASAHLASSVMESHARSIASATMEGYAKTISDLDGPLRTRVLSGQTTKQQWRSVAESVWGGIAITSNYVSSSNFSAFWKEVVVKSAVDVGKAIPTKTQFSLWLGLIVVGLVAIVIIKVS